jgi:hypothetical protein
MISKEMKALVDEAIWSASEAEGQATRFPPSEHPHYRDEWEPMLKQAQEGIDALYKAIEDLEQHVEAYKRFEPSECFVCGAIQVDEHTCNPAQELADSELGRFVRQHGEDILQAWEYWYRNEDGNITGALPELNALAELRKLLKYPN